ncbi:MAG: M81 family metallopeptidase [Pirellulaceae bacterium]
MPRRVLIAELKQETATFNPAPTVYDDFRVYCDGDVLDKYRGTKTELAGAIDVFKAAGIEPVPTMAAHAVSGGPIETASLDRLLDEMVERIRRGVQIDGVEAVYLCLHGAMAGEQEVDPEGRLLRDVRDVVFEMPLVASLDLHAILTERMIAAADVLVPFHTYPHVDQYETGQRAARCLLKLLDGGARPKTIRLPLPMLVRGDELITRTGRFGEAIRRCQQVEADPRGLAAGVIIGNAFTDVPDLQSNVLITVDDADGAYAFARHEADAIARFMWDNRALFQARLTSLDDALRLADETTGLTVFSDAADATASGASGDSNAILGGLLHQPFAGTSLVPIVDAPAVDAAVEAGVGATIDTTLGGTRDAGRFRPLPVVARVVSLHDGLFAYEDGTEGNAGGVAVLQIGMCTVMATRRPVYVVGRAVFEAHGLNPRDFDVVVVKSPNGFRTWYESVAARIVPVDVPGSTSANLRSLPYQHCVRPIFPLDENVEW